MGKKIILKASSFKYPSKDELRLVDKKGFNLKVFDFGFEGLMTSILELNKPLKIAHKENSLNEWNRCLLNKIGKLSRTYSLAVVNFNRGIPERGQKFLKKHELNRIQFEYYCEIFYYFFFSTTDIIGQILNTHYDLGLKENGVQFKKLKLGEESVQILLDNFTKETSLANTYRNSFTHRYPLNLPDYRTSLEIKDNRHILGAGIGTVISPNEFISNMKSSLESLSSLLSGLNKVFNEKKTMKTS